MKSVFQNILLSMFTLCVIALTATIFTQKVKAEESTGNSVYVQPNNDVFTCTFNLTDVGYINYFDFSQTTTGYYFVTTGGNSATDYSCWMYDFDTGNIVEQHSVLWKQISTSGYEQDWKTFYFWRPQAYFEEYLTTSTIPVFKSITGALNYINNGDTTYVVYMPVPPFDPMTDDYDDTIPYPQIYIDNNNLRFSNGDENLKVLVNVRWISINDIVHIPDKRVPFKPWEFEYQSIISSDLYTVYDNNDSISSLESIELSANNERFNQTFQVFLGENPVSVRNTVCEKNVFGNYPSAYEANKQLLETYLSQPFSPYSVPEIYLRYYYESADGIKCGKWTKYSYKLCDSKNYMNYLVFGSTTYQVSDKGLTTNEVVNGKPYDFDNTITYSKKDNTTQIDVGTIDFTEAKENLKDIMSMFGSIPDLVKSIFGFLPPWIIALLCGSITLLMALAIYHGVRG